jgi:hypothetical protein
MLRITRFILCCLLLSQTATAAPAQYAFRISFRDKAGAPPLSSTPAWLSIRSMSRRANFHIIPDSTDQPVSPLYLDSVLSISGGKLHNTSRWLNQCVVLVTDTSNIALLRAKPWVKNVQWVGYFASGLHRQQTPSASHPKSERVLPLSFPYSGAKQSGNASYYGATYGQTVLVHGDTLHDQGFRGKGKLIALLDEGFIDVDTHPGFDSMRQQGRLLETYDFVHNSSFVFGYDEHGTNCFSTIAGLRPGTYVGTAPDAMFALYVTEDGNFTDALYETDNLIAGMERADSLGADIISASIGYNTFESPFSTSFSKSELDGKTTNMARAVNLAAAKGILYITSAGNEGGNWWNFLISPADADSALTVGAVTPSGVAASFSSPGPNAAGHVKPNVCLQGDPAAILSTNGGTGVSSGTSFAAPQAAGYAACLMQAFPTAPPGVIRSTFQSISHLYPGATPSLGYGIPDFRRALGYLRRLLSDSALPLSVYPNPFRNSFTIGLPKLTSTFELSMTDMLGHTAALLPERDGPLVHVTTGVLRSGVYILRIVADGQLYAVKLVHY